MDRDKFMDIHFSDGEVMTIMSTWINLKFIDSKYNVKNQALGLEFALKVLAGELQEGRLSTIFLPLIRRIIIEYEEELPQYIIKHIVWDVRHDFPVDELIEYTRINQTHYSMIDAEWTFIHGYCDKYEKYPI